MHRTEKDKALHKESVFVKIDHHRLHMRRFYCDAEGEGVLLVHGSMEDSKIFYSKSDKGLAPFLARCGYDVFALDLRGRGESRPKVSAKDDFGLNEAITEDIPLAAKQIRRIKGALPKHWMAHSWGGVLQLASVLRFPELRPESMVFFSSKRNIWVKNFGKFLQIDLFWRIFFGALVKWKGYLPHHPSFFGSADESAGFHRDTTMWIDAKEWLDPKDGFDYGAASMRVENPPTLYMTGAADKVLGHPDDVLRFMKQANGTQDQFLYLSRENGFLHNYDHINIMTHRDAEKDHFQHVLKWIRDKALS